MATTVCLLPLLAACGTPSSAHSGAVRFAVPAAISLDPAQSDTSAGLMVSSLLYSGLVKFGPDMHVIPELAVSMPTISNDGLRYTFTIRQDARFATGRPCTGRDVAYSLARSLQPGVSTPMSRSMLKGIAGARAVERGRAARLSGVRVLHRLTVRIQLTHPDAAFLEKLAMPAAAVLDRFRARAAWVGTPHGTGPWYVAAREHDGTLDLEPRPHYYGGPLQVREVRLVPAVASRAGIDLYRKSEVDVAEVPTSLFAGWSGRADFHQSAALEAYYALPLGTDAAMLAAHLDRATLVSAVPGLSSLSSMVPLAVPDYVSSPPTFSDTEGHSPKVHLALDERNWTLGRLARGLSRQWPPLARGVPVRLVAVRSLVPDPGWWLSALDRQVRSRWYHRLLARASALTNDPVTRMDAYNREETWALEQGLVIPLANGSLGYLIKPRIEGLQVTPLGLMPENNSWSALNVSG